MKQLFTFFGLAFLISWAIWFPLYGHVFGLNNLPSIPFNHALGGLGPLVASILATWIFLKTKGIKDLLQRCFQIKPLIYLAIALLGPFVLAFIAELISYFINKGPLNLSELLSTKEFPKWNFLIFFIYNIFFFGFGEEVGWRGFALPRLLNKTNAFVSSIIITIFWALWHLPLFFYKDGFTTMELTGILGWVFSLLTGSILLTWLYNSSRGSILVCVIFHSTIDIAFSANFSDKNIVNYMGFLITVWGILTIIIFKPKHLSGYSTTIKNDK